MDAARRSQATVPAWRPRQPRDAGDTSAGRTAAFGLSPERKVPRPNLARTSAGQPQIVKNRHRRRPPLDLRWAIDARRGRPPQEPDVRLLLIFLLLVAAVGHLLLPFGPLREAHAVDPGLADLILIQLRLPRTLLALGYGATLGISGAALQAMFANPLASPDISGASSGAALGAVIGGYWLGLTQPLLLAACGAAGALGILTLLIALAGRRADTT